MWASAGALVDLVAAVVVARFASVWNWFEASASVDAERLWDSYCGWLEDGQGPCLAEVAIVLHWHLRLLFSLTDLEL